MSRRAELGEKPRVFISHSATGDAATLATLHQLRTRLDGDFSVLVDQDLQPGTSWRHTLNTWIGACDAAVLLLTEKALLSDFVAYEVGILTYRENHAGDKKCKVIPVFLPPVDYKAVQAAKGFGPAQLNETQAVIAKTTEEQIQKIEAALVGVKCGITPLDDQEIFLENLFSSPSFPLAKVEQALSQLGVTLDGWDVNPCRSLALAFLSRGLDKSTLKRIDELRGYIKDGESLEALFEIVATSWIDLRSVRSLERIATGAQKGRVLALNAAGHLIASKYVHRAGNRPPTDPWPMAPVTATDLSAKALQREIDRAIRQQIGLSESEDLKEALETMESLLDKPVLVALPAAGVSDSILAQLRATFPTVTFFLLAGDEEPVLQCILQQQIEILEPRLQAGFESAFTSQYTIARTVIVDTYLKTHGLQRRV